MALRPNAGTSVSRRNELVHTAASLFASRGYAGVAMDEIGAAVDISGPALYWHFNAKEELLAEVFRSVGDQFLVRGIAAVAEGGEVDEVLQRLLHAHAEVARQEPAMTTVYLRERPPQGEAARSYERTRAIYLELWAAVLNRLDHRLGGVMIASIVEPTLAALAQAVLGINSRNSVEVIDELCRAADSALRSYLVAAHPRKVNTRASD